MGLIIAPNSLLAKSQSLIEQAKERQQDLEGLLSILNNIVNDETLKGASYSSAKNCIQRIYIVDIKAILLALEHEINANQLVIEQCAIYLSGIDYIDVDIIQNTINSNEEIANYFEGIANNTIAPYDQHPRAVVESLRSQNRYLQRQIERVYEFNKATCNLHNEVSLEIETIERNLSATFATFHSIGTNVTFWADLLKWSTEYEKQWNKLPTQQEKQFMQNLQTQFGFDERTATIMWDVYLKIQEKYQDLTQQERDYRFTRLLSQLFYDSSAESSFMKGAWASGAGIINQYDSLGFCTTLGILDKDFQYLRFTVRLQHFICSGLEEYSPPQIEEELMGKNSATYYNNMKLGLNISSEDMTEELYMEYYKAFYNSYDGKSDFAHMMYTIAAGIAPSSTEGLDDENFTYNVMGQSIVMWDSSETRIDYVGWLGDATWPGVKGNPGLWDYGNTIMGTKNDNSMYGDLASMLNSDTSIGNDDYMADLDADNIIHRYNGEMSVMDVLNTYYYETSSGDKRAEEFLQNNKITDVENAIIERAGGETIEELNEKWPSSYNFIDNLKQGNGVMK